MLDGSCSTAQRRRERHADLPPHIRLKSIRCALYVPYTGRDGVPEALPELSRPATIADHAVTIMATRTRVLEDQAVTKQLRHRSEGLGVPGLVRAHATSRGDFWHI